MTQLSQPTVAALPMAASNELTVHVVAWQSNGSGGFDWYLDKDDADKAYITEKSNCKHFASESWECCQVEETVSDVESATLEIENSIWELPFSEHTNHYKHLQ